jgi:hypothetical protein
MRLTRLQTGVKCYARKAGLKAADLDIRQLLPTSIVILVAANLALHSQQQPSCARLLLTNTARPRQAQSLALPGLGKNGIGLAFGWLSAAFIRLLNKHSQAPRKITSFIGRGTIWQFLISKA